MELLLSGASSNVFRSRVRSAAILVLLMIENKKAQS